MKGKDEYKTDYANILRNIAFVFFKLNNHAEARNYFEMAIHKDPSFALAWNSKGYHMILHYDKLREITSKGDDDLKQETILDFKNAIDCFKKKSKLDANIAYAFYNKGYAHFLLKQYQAAIQCLKMRHTKNMNMLRHGIVRASVLICYISKIKVSHLQN